MDTSSFMKWASAFASAILVPALILPIVLLVGTALDGSPIKLEEWAGFGLLFVICSMVAAAYVVILWLPAYLILQKFKRVSGWTLMVTGFVLGGFPVAILSWPMRFSALKSSSYVDGALLVSEGMPTLMGWLKYLSGVTFFGFCGLVGAASFWWVISRGYKRPLYLYP